MEISFLNTSWFYRASQACGKFLGEINLNSLIDRSGMSTMCAIGPSGWIFSRRRRGENRVDCGYLAEEKQAVLCRGYEQVGAMAWTLMTRWESFK